MNRSAKLILVPTPIDEEWGLESTALQWLLDRCLKNEVGLLIEDHKVARQRWLKWGLPREAIERFVLYNEHTEAAQVEAILLEMKAGKQFFLLSDAGLPAFCDPGQRLVNRCHESGLAVTSTPFPHSMSLALALSGYSHREFFFAGFLPASTEERRQSLEKLTHFSCTLVLMDTPYRLQSLLKDFAKSGLKSREVFVGTGLNSSTEKLYRGSIGSVMKAMGDVNKVEFVMVVSSKI